MWGDTGACVRSLTKGGVWRWLVTLAFALGVDGDVRVEKPLAPEAGVDVVSNSATVSTKALRRGDITAADENLRGNEVTAD